MSLLHVPAGKNPPEDVYVIVETPMNTPYVKYEVDKDTGVLFVDRFVPMAVVYPAHYGYINNTLCDDGDPVDVLLYTDIQVPPGTVVRARPIGLLNTSDQSGDDPKVICVPHDKLDRRYAHVKSIEDIHPLAKEQLEQFFQHHKNMEPGKFVKLGDWGDATAAKKCIADGVAAVKKST